MHKFPRQADDHKFINEMEEKKCAMSSTLLTYILRSLEREVAMDQVTLNLDFGFCKFQGEMYSKKEVRQGNHMDQIF